MSEESMVFEVGDPVVWWCDGHGRGLPAEHPDALRLTGTVDGVYFADADRRVVSAYLVTCRSGIAGTYLATVRPDHGHRPELAR